jgi:hypothetical protein
MENTKLIPETHDTGGSPVPVYSHFPLNYCQRHLPAVYIVML